MGLREQVIRQWEEHEARDAARKAKQSPPAGVVGIRDLEYLPSGGWQHRLDVFRPEGEAGVLPVIVDIHGGGWMYGNKELNEYYCMDLASRGFVVIDLNYTLVPDTDLRGQIEDIAAALNWCFDHGEQYGYDGKRLCVTGDSAGGHLAFLICGIANSPGYRKRYQVLPLKGEIRALGLVCPADLKAMESDPDPLRRQRCRMIYGTEPTVSPLWNCSGWEDVVGICKLPPIFLLTTQEDRIHYPQARRLHRLLVEHQADHLFVQWPASGERVLGHVFNVLHHEYPESGEANQRMIDFFEEKIEEAVKYDGV